MGKFRRHWSMTSLLNNNLMNLKVNFKNHNSKITNNSQNQMVNLITSLKNNSLKSPKKTLITAEVRRDLSIVVTNINLKARMTNQLATWMVILVFQALVNQQLKSQPLLYLKSVFLMIIVLLRWSNILQNM